MKKLINTAFAIVIIALGLTVISGLETSELDAQPSRARDLGSELFASYIDGIKIPTEVLMRIQMDHQGYAVTKASKTTRNSREVYQLRVDRDTAGNGSKSFYLIYDLKWKRLAKVNAPEPVQLFVQPDKVEPKHDEDEKPDEEVKPDKPVQDSRGGGSGGEEEEPQQEPDPEPEPEPTNGNSGRNRN